HAHNKQTLTPLLFDRYSLGEQSFLSASMMSAIFAQLLARSRTVPMSMHAMMHSITHPTGIEHPGTQLRMVGFSLIII
ncbi:MAG: hypothetical protein MJY89_10245, partial [Bacteroidales bacterium]|nr:hypothetical protein [Bacteroidales bacterium]